MATEQSFWKLKLFKNLNISEMFLLFDKKLAQEINITYRSNNFWGISFSAADFGAGAQKDIIMNFEQ